jgi:hypothetical protein
MPILEYLITILRPYMLLISFLLHLIIGEISLTLPRMCVFERFPRALQRLEWFAEKKYTFFIFFKCVHAKFENCCYDYQ